MSGNFGRIETDLIATDPMEAPGTSRVAAGQRLMSPQEPEVPPEAAHIPEEASPLAAVLASHGKQILLGTLGVLALLIVAAVLTSGGRSPYEKEWSRFADAKSASDFADVASDFPNTDVAVWAKLTEGEMLLHEAVRLQFSDRKASESQLKDAGKAFDEVIEQAGGLPDAMERGLLGKARFLEATCKGDTTEVVKAYDAFLGRFPDSVYKDSIQNRVESLKSKDAQAFYAWFSQQNPKPEDRARPQDGLPAGHPEIPVSLPPIPEELYPSDWSELKIDEKPDSGAGNTPETDTQATESSASSEETQEKE